MLRRTRVDFVDSAEDGGELAEDDELEDDDELEEEDELDDPGELTGELEEDERVLYPEEEGVTGSERHSFAYAEASTSLSFSKVLFTNWQYLAHFAIRSFPRMLRTSRNGRLSSSSPPNSAG